MNPVYLLAILLTFSGIFYHRGENVYPDDSPSWTASNEYPVNTGEWYADTCCLNSQMFGQNVRNSLKLEVVDSMCEVKLIVDQLPGCDSVYFIDWGDGELDYGPYSNGIITHTYTETGNYKIQVPVVEFDPNGDPCFDTLMKYQAEMDCTCECGNYALTVNLNGIKSSVECGGLIALACPTPDSLDFTGFFNCIGNACSDSEILWTLTGPELELEDFVSPDNFKIKIPYLLNPGLYELNIQSKCGQQLCECSVTIYLSPCLIAEVCNDYCQGSTWSHFNATLIQDMEFYNGQLIVAGLFSIIGREDLPVNNIAAWDGNTWVALEGGGLNNKVNDLEIHDGILYAGGDFTQAGNIEADKIAAWDGSSWSALSHGGINGNFTNVDALLATSGGLIVGGKFTSVGDPALNVSNIAAWNPGNGWAKMGSNLDGPVFALALFHGKIVAGGRFGNIPGGFNNIAIWNGEWTKLGEQGAVNIKSATPHPDDGVHTLAVYKDQLIAGGQFFNTMTDSLPNNHRTRHIAQWNGSQWAGLSAGTGVDLGSGVYSIKVFGDDLIAGGKFTRINNQPVNHLAKYNGMNWTGMLHPSTGGVRTIVSYKSSEDIDCKLYTGGELGMNQWSCSTVAVTNQNQSSLISIFPNPAIDHFFIKLPDYGTDVEKIEIYSLFGQKMMEQIFFRIPREGTLKIHIPGIASGTYLIKLTSKGNTVVKRILIRSRV